MRCPRCFEDASDILEYMDIRNLPGMYATCIQCDNVWYVKKLDCSFDSKLIRVTN